MLNWIMPRPIEKDDVGFVYIITNQINGVFYLGQKKLFFKHTLKPLKGRKNKRHRLVESDWKTYMGSSKELLEDIEKLGTNNFRREIIKFCKRKAEMNYVETELQFKYKVLLSDDSYNKIINCRISRNQLKFV